MRSLGAEETVDHTRRSVAESVRASHPDGVDGLLDMASDGKGFTELAHLVRPGGVALTTAFVGDQSALEGRQVRVVNIDLQPRADLLERLSAELVAGRLRIPVESKVPLDEAPAAFTRARSLSGRGKTVIVL
jgi:NADPH:quinone reductase-like Zn-dependent oxidoreductase